MKRGTLILVVVIMGLVGGFAAGALIGFMVPMVLGASMNDAAQVEAVTGPLGAVVGAIWLGRRAARNRAAA